MRCDATAAAEESRSRSGEAEPYACRHHAPRPGINGDEAATIAERTSARCAPNTCRRTAVAAASAPRASGCRTLTAKNRRYVLARVRLVARSCLRLAARFTPYARKCLAQI